MRRTLLSFLFLGASLLTIDAQAQTRYLDPIFNSSQITVTQNVVYGQNIEVLTGAPVLIDLKMDVYQPDPAVDPLAQRPLIIILHTGNYLPIVINGSPTGTKMDSSIVNLSKQWAQRGFVVASIDYRLGWNPLASGTPTSLVPGLLMANDFAMLVAVRAAPPALPGLANPYCRADFDRSGHIGVSDIFSFLSEWFSGCP